MPIVQGATAPQFKLEGTTITGLASPSRGSHELSTWRVLLDPGTRVPAHILSREEVFVVLSGSATATIDGDPATITSGDALVVPPGVPFALSVSGGAAFEAVAMMGVGGTASMVDGGGAPFAPPWSL